MSESASPPDVPALFLSSCSATPPDVATLTALLETDFLESHHIYEGLRILGASDISSVHESVFVKAIDLLISNPKFPSEDRQLLDVDFGNLLRISYEAWNISFLRTFLKMSDAPTHAHTGDDSSLSSSSAFSTQLESCVDLLRSMLESQVDIPGALESRSEECRKIVREWLSLHEKKDEDKGEGEGEDAGEELEEETEEEEEEEEEEGEEGVISDEEEGDVHESYRQAALSLGEDADEEVSDSLPGDDRSSRPRRKVKIRPTKKQKRKHRRHPPPRLGVGSRPRHRNRRMMRRGRAGIHAGDSKPKVMIEDDGLGELGLVVSSSHSESDGVGVGEEGEEDSLRRPRRKDFRMKIPAFRVDRESAETEFKTDDGAEGDVDTDDLESILKRYSYGDIDADADASPSSAVLVAGAGDVGDGDVLPDESDWMELTKKYLDSEDEAELSPSRTRPQTAGPSASGGSSPVSPSKSNLLDPVDERVVGRVIARALGEQALLEFKKASLIAAQGGLTPVTLDFDVEKELALGDDEFPDVEPDVEVGPEASSASEAASSEAGEPSPSTDSVLPPAIDVSPTPDDQVNPEEPIPSPASASPSPPDPVPVIPEPASTSSAPPASPRSLSNEEKETPIEEPEPTRGVGFKIAVAGGLVGLAAIAFFAYKRFRKSEE